MDPLVADAMLPMSFLDLYRVRGRGQDTIAIALAMTGVLMINMLSIALFRVSGVKAKLTPLHRGAKSTIWKESGTRYVTVGAPE